MANITLDVSAPVLPDAKLTGQTPLLTRRITETMRSRSQCEGVCTRGPALYLLDFCTDQLDCSSCRNKIDCPSAQSESGTRAAHSVSFDTSMHVTLRATSGFCGI